MSVDYEPLLSDHWNDPYQSYRRLRDEAPVHWAPKSEFWCVSRYEDVARVLRTPEDFSSEGAFEALASRGRRFGPRDLLGLARYLLASRINPVSVLRGRNPSPMMISLDAPRHDVLRAIVNRGFTPRRVQAWEARMRGIAADCVARLAEGDAFDVVHELAIPLPVTIIAEMLGIEIGRRAQFKQWSDDIIAGSSGGLGTSFESSLRAMGDLHRYLRGIVRQRRREPRDDLISLLVDEREGEALEDREVAQFVILLLIAGNETTTNLIGNTTRVLLERPEVVAEVNARPELVPAMIEEALRFESPIQYVMRRATRDVEIAGTKIEKNSFIVALLASANRDERHYANADELDLTRSESPHLTFGRGRHVCVGAKLVRMQMAAALPAIVQRLESLELRDARVRRVPRFGHRWLESLHVLFEPF